MINEEIKLKRKKEMIDKVLAHQIRGDSYFKSSEENWKNIVLRKFNAVYRNELSVFELIEILKKEGVEFTQNEKIIYYPIKELLEYISKLSKREINLM